jgi:hypothetical protein
MDEIKTLLEREKEIASNIFAINSGIEGLLPIADGIINVEKYIKAKYKILWILKEPVDDWVIPEGTSKLRNGGWNLVLDIYNKLTIEEIKKEKKLFVARKVMEATYKLLPEANDELEAFKSIAYINIKKIPGGSSKNGKSSNRSVLKAEYIKNKDLLEKQIETYNPDIVICGNTLQFLSEDDYFEKPHGSRQPFKEGKQFCYYLLENRLYINIHHPAFYHSNNGLWKDCINEIVGAFYNWEKKYGGNNNG